MSVIFKARLLWVLPVVVVASWMAVRALAASTVTLAPALPAATVVAVNAPLPTPANEIKDAALGRYIARLAAKAKQR